MMFPFRSSPSLPRVGLRHLARPNHARQAVANRAVPSSASRRSSRMPRTPRASSHPLRTCGMGGDVGLRASSDAVELRDEGDGAGDDAEHEASVKHRVEQVLQRWGHSRLGRGEDGARDSRARAREQGRGKLLRVANVGARPNGGGLPRGSTWPGWRETTNERRRARASVGGFESAAARGHSVRELAPSLKRVRRARSRQPGPKGSTIEGSTVCTRRGGLRANGRFATRPPIIRASESQLTLLGAGRPPRGEARLGPRSQLEARPRGHVHGSVHGPFSLLARKIGRSPLRKADTQQARSNTCTHTRSRWGCLLYCSASSRSSRRRRHPVRGAGFGRDPAKGGGTVLLAVSVEIAL